MSDMGTAEKIAITRAHLDAAAARLRILSDDNARMLRNYAWSPEITKRCKQEITVVRVLWQLVADARERINVSPS